MKKNLFILASLLLGIINHLFNQTNKNGFYNKILHADSVVIVSYITEPIIDEKTDEVIGVEELVIKNKLNTGIIKQSYRLSEKDIDTLATLITTPFSETRYAESKCFQPHHGVLIFNKNICSWMEICFSCRHFISSKDIELSDMLNYKTWNDLAVFFKKRNCGYKIGE